MGSSCAGEEEDSRTALWASERGRGEAGDAYDDDEDESERDAAFVWNWNTTDVSAEKCLSDSPEQQRERISPFERATDFPFPTRFPLTYVPLVLVSSTRKQDSALLNTMWQCFELILLSCQVKQLS